MASFPGSIKNFPTLTDGVDSVLALHQNERANEIEAIEANLGTNPHGSFATVKDRILSLEEGFISAAGAYLIWNSTSSISLAAGSAAVNGVVLTWASLLTLSGLTPTANTVYYVYLYSSGGSAAIEVSATVPEWDSSLNYWKKTADATRRCVGYYAANGSGQVRKFLNFVNGRTSEFIIVDGGGTGRRLLNGVTISTDWTLFSFGAFVPANASHAWVNMYVSSPTVGETGILGVCPIDMGASLASESPFQARSKIATANQINHNMLWLPFSDAPNYYYRIQQVVGTDSVGTLDIHGARMIR
jgi:hypothetical protein